MTTENDTSTETEDEQETEGQPAKGEPDHKAEAAKWKALARKHETQAKTNASAAKELAEVRKSSMTDQEKAVAKARDEAKVEARAEMAAGRAEDAIRFAIGDRLPAGDLDELLADLNLTRFVKEDGTFDRDKVKAYVDRIAPQKRRQVDLGQGARGGGAGSGDGSFLLDAIRNRNR